MAVDYRFVIENSFTPETLPMERLAEYVAALAKLLGERDCVHFRGIEPGSAVLVATVDSPARPKVRERVIAVRDGSAPDDAARAYADLDEMLRKDNATGTLSGEAGGVVVSFPGRNRREPRVIGPFRQDGTIDGQLIRVGGKDETVPVHLRDGAIIHTGLIFTPEIARKIARAVRGRDGGLRYVKALGFELKDRGIVQVSMNLVDLGVTGLREAFDAVRREAERRGLRVFDATCPLVTKVHIEVARMREEGREIVMIGHRGHPEVEGTMGQSEGGMYLVEGPEDVARLAVRDPERLAFVTQTTLSVDDARETIEALRKRFPRIVGPKKDDICYATQNRQDAVKALARRADVVIVVGSPNSSNSNRLREVAQNQGVPAYMVDDAAELRREWVEGAATVGVTAGASAPEVLVQQVVARLREWGASRVETLPGIEERVSFSLPRDLVSVRAAAGRP
ncbi:MAG: 4-hydroxy-3-methylbut-2-enyl diphosphate reductase [Geminicoccaceae bacterium]|nr:4-hydroxy-3-methylbut-2-enyl diphosphate reductase [Geminicoccaceae bacterium]